MISSWVLALPFVRVRREVTMSCLSSIGDPVLLEEVARRLLVYASFLGASACHKERALSRRLVRRAIEALESGRDRRAEELRPA